ncbi:MAG: phosphoribosylaminoimidazolesuccinocarboxamide synthase [bacterium]
MDTEREGKSSEGKTKIIYNTSNFNYVDIVHKDDITAGNGKRHDIIKGKGVFSNDMTCNIFERLCSEGIPNHFVRVTSDNSFLAVRLLMLKTEVVVRGRADGSYLKRYPDVEKGTKIDPLVVEFYLKDDKQGDPLMEWNQEQGLFKLWDPSKPRKGDNSTFVGFCRPELRLASLNPSENMSNVPTNLVELAILRELSLKSFILLHRLWRILGYDLWDMKIECGRTQNGIIIIGDALTNDEHRLTFGDEQMDKQVYRNLKEVTPEALAMIRQKYQRVASETRKFL